MKKLSEDYAEVRDLLLNLFFGIEPVNQIRDWGYNRAARNTSHNYDRDREIGKGKFIIIYKGKSMARVQCKPHKSIVIRHQQGKYRLYRSLLDRAVRDYVPGVRIEYKPYV